MKQITAICPGSFDPVTLGHTDIITRASKMFSKVIVAVMPNAKKQSAFTAQERAEMLLKCVADLPNVEVEIYDGLLADFAFLKNANAIVKGLRAISDFEYEFQMALMNEKMNKNAETVFFTTRAENLFLSSSAVKAIAAKGGNIKDFVPLCVHDFIAAKLANI